MIEDHKANEVAFNTYHEASLAYDRAKRQHESYEPEDKVVKEGKQPTDIESLRAELHKAQQRLSEAFKAFEDGLPEKFGPKPDGPVFIGPSSDQRLLVLIKSKGIYTTYKEFRNEAEVHQAWAAESERLRHQKSKGFFRH